MSFNESTSLHLNYNLQTRNASSRVCGDLRCALKAPCWGHVGAVTFQQPSEAAACAQGWHEDAHSSFQRAGETARSDLPDDPARSFMPPRAAQELQAGALLGRGQALWALKSRQDDALGPRDTAEDILAQVRAQLKPIFRFWGVGFRV